MPPRLRFRRLLAALPALALAGPAPAAVAFVVATGEIWSVDLATGDRTYREIGGYPGIIAVRAVAVESESSVLLATFSAVQSPGIFRFHMPTGTRTPLSGDVLGDTSNLLGGGPDFEPNLLAIELGRPGEALVLRAFQGPMAADLATGDRTVVSQSADPPTGDGFPLAEPVDFAVLPDGDLLVMELFQGVVHVDRETGLRKMHYPNAEFTITPELIALLPDGRVAHLNVGQDTDALFAYNPATEEDELLTGNFGGNSRGEGPTILAPSDIAVAPDGTLLVYDLAPPTILSVNLHTGDRTIVSGGAQNRGSGSELPTEEFKPRLAAKAPIPAEESWQIR